MDIFTDKSGRWMFGMAAGGFKYSVRKDGSISLIRDGKSEYPRDIIMLNTGRGCFVETLDADGKVINEGGDGDWYHIQLGKKPVAVRHKKLADPHLSVPQINRARQKVRRVLVDDQPSSAGVPHTLPGLIKWAEKYLRSIPKDCRKSARVDFDTSMSYGETYPHVEISYWQPESDAEVIERVKIERERARLLTIKKSAELERLKRELSKIDAPHPTNRRG